jgi:hypothetical protein
VKRPSFQWYPGDFRRDTGVQACCFEARSLWREMMDLMHDGEPYGHLTAGGVSIKPENLARLVGMPVAKVTRWLKELEDHKVFSKTEAGVIYSRRMVRDESKRSHAAKCGDASTRPTSARSGTTGALFNFLFERWGGCLWCDSKDALELHRITAGRHGGKYEPGNVLLLCHADHEKAGYGELTVDSILKRCGAGSALALFVGFKYGSWDITLGGNGQIPKAIPPSNTHKHTRQTPSAVAVASAVAVTTKPKATAQTSPFPKSVCDPLYEAWISKRGAIEYSAFRKALSPLFPASGPRFAQDALVGAIDAHAEYASILSPKDARFENVYSFAANIDRWIKLGSMPAQLGDGTLTERGRLIMEGVL